MHKALAHTIVAGALILLQPLAACADPVKLKLSFFTSDRSNIYQNSIKPFVDAVNEDGHGLIEIQVYFSGSISKIQADQPQLVTDGVADLALIVPGRTPDRFSDTAVMELPGLYRDQRQASLIYTHLIEAGALKGYGDYFVIGAFVAGGESIHSSKVILTNNDLRGLTIRTNNKTEAALLKKLGAIPVPLAINETTEALNTNKIDGATFPPSMLFDFGFGRVATSHFMIDLGGVPTALVMSRTKFESLPPQAQAIIRKYSGQWLAERSAASFGRLDKKTLEELKSDPRRKVTFLSPADLESTQRVAASAVEDWAASNPRNRELLARVKAEIAKLNSDTTGAQ